MLIRKVLLLSEGATPGGPSWLAEMTQITVTQKRSQRGGT